MSRLVDSVGTRLIDLALRQRTLHVTHDKTTFISRALHCWEIKGPRLSKMESFYMVNAIGGCDQHHAPWLPFVKFGEFE
jgi:hypothetical protein